MKGYFEFIDTQEGRNTGVCEFFGREGVQDFHSEGDRRNHAAGSLQRWNDIVGDAFVGGVVDAPQENFDAELWRGEIGDIHLVRIRAQPSRVSRWLHGSPSNASGKMLLHLQAEGTSINEQSRRQSRAGAGEAVLCAADRSYSVDFLTPYEMFVVELPLSAIVGRIPDFDLDCMVGQKVDTRRSQLLLAFLQTAWSQRECLAADLDWRDCGAGDFAIRAYPRRNGQQSRTAQGCPELYPAKSQRS